MNETPFDFGGGKPDRWDSIQVKFEYFHRKHPEVYRALVALARHGVAQGRTTLGIGQLFEVLRWEWFDNSLPDDQEDFKLSNSYRSRYARLIMATEPDLVGIFNTKPLTAP